jgi:hypothetical protein
MKRHYLVIIITLIAWLFNWTFGQRSIEAKEPVWLKKSIKAEVLKSQESYYTNRPECFGRAVICKY